MDVVFGVLSLSLGEGCGLWGAVVGLALGPIIACVGRAEPQGLRSGRFLPRESVRGNRLGRIRGRPNRDQTSRAFGRWLLADGSLMVLSDAAGQYLRGGNFLSVSIKKCVLQGLGARAPLLIDGY